VTSNRHLISKDNGGGKSRFRGGTDGFQTPHSPDESGRVQVISGLIGEGKTVFLPRKALSVGRGGAREKVAVLSGCNRLEKQIETSTYCAGGEPFPRGETQGETRSSGPLCSSS